jgi:hypothetical protein
MIMATQNNTVDDSVAATLLAEVDKFDSKAKELRDKLLTARAGLMSEVAKLDAMLAKLPKEKAEKVGRSPKKRDPLSAEGQILKLLGEAKDNKPLTRAEIIARGWPKLSDRDKGKLWLTMNNLVASKEVIETPKGLQLASLAIP